MIKLKELITEQAKKSDVKKMEKMADKIVADMTKLNFMFRKKHIVPLYSMVRSWNRSTKRD